MENAGGRGEFDLNNPPPPEVEDPNPPFDAWPIRKILSKCDADPSICGVRLPVRQIRKYLLPFLPPDKTESLQNQNPIAINVANDDIPKAYRVKLKYQKSCSSYMLQETRSLVTEARLEAGQVIKLRWISGGDGEEGTLHFSLQP